MAGLAGHWRASLYFLFLTSHPSIGPVLIGRQRTSPAGNINGPLLEWESVFSMQIGVLKPIGTLAAARKDFQPRESVDMTMPFLLCSPLPRFGVV
jgi:hypothetical protein